MSGAGHLLISKVIADQSLTEVTKAGVKASHFAGDLEKVWQWIIEFSTKHGAVPNDRQFQRAFGHIELVDTSTESTSALIEELFEAYKRRTIVDAVSEAVPKLDKGDIKGAMEQLQRGLHESAIDAVRLRDFNVIETWEERLNKYEEARNQPNSLRGIPTGFSGLDAMTFGFRPQQLIILAGEQKRFKSFFSLIMAMAAHTAGRVPLFVSFEMSADEQVSRYDALLARVPYDRILSGNLTTEEMARLRKSMSLRKNMQPFIVSEDTSSLTTVSALNQKVIEYKPHILFVDGVYLMDDELGEDKGSPQAITNITRGLKRLSQNNDIPVVGTTQVLSWKLHNKTTRRITADSLGWSSSWGQDADLVLGVENDPDIDDQSIIRVVEARTAPRNTTIYVKRDWTTMTFEEVASDGSDIISNRYYD